MSSDSKHQSAGAIIKDDLGRILMINRTNFPFGWAIPAGHVDTGETPEQAVIRETKEEVNLNIIKMRLVGQEFLSWNKCSRGTTGHEFSIFEVLSWQGKIKGEADEMNDWRWIKKNKLPKIKIEEATEYWFKKLGYL
ncbi:MAG TPA: NUDIX hydrolase [Candidatus Methylomirabilis sp.]|nr:NUDIX hydrolase [Candidatus Methylomirabilis sp.]